MRGCTAASAARSCADAGRADVARQAVAQAATQGHRGDPALFVNRIAATAGLASGGPAIAGDDYWPPFLSGDFSGSTALAPLGSLRTALAARCAAWTVPVAASEATCSVPVATADAPWAIAWPGFLAALLMALAALAGAVAPSVSAAAASETAPSRAQVIASARIVMVICISIRVVDSNANIALRCVPPQRSRG